MIQARTEYLRGKARAALEHPTGWRKEGETCRETCESEHINLFPLEDWSKKQGNPEYLREKKEEKEKQERAMGLLVSLGPAPGTEATPWYLKSSEREKDKGKRTFTEEEREKKDQKLKDRLDPMNDINKALGVTERREKKKEKKREKREKTSGKRSMEQLRAERLQREAVERKRAQALLDQWHGVGKAAEEQKETDDRERPYNSAYFPELARKRRRRDRDVHDFLHSNS
ncbi:leukocyte receptor cluster member 1 isoform X2 [Neoarius graeffei]|uniref:leukocyte receptor cluster member 1 isoform X2 n=1 Tax=Neoarius graeffei TaxID=443677 RepID=UPI00298BEABC|nr:leukocyte receptor cluster member 1 isoform X2 [Neoarius graeffei]